MRGGVGFRRPPPKDQHRQAQGRPHCGVRTKTRNQCLRVAWTARQSHSAQLRLRWAFAQGIMRAILRSCAKEAERRRLQPRKITSDDWTSGTRSHTLQAAQLIHDAEGFSSRLQRPKPANPRPKRLTVSGAKEAVQSWLTDCCLDGRRAPGLFSDKNHAVRVARARSGVGPHQNSSRSGAEKHENRRGRTIEEGCGGRRGGVQCGSGVGAAAKPSWASWATATSPNKSSLRRPWWCWTHHLCSCLSCFYLDPLLAVAGCYFDRWPALFLDSGMYEPAPLACAVAAVPENHC